MPNIIKKQKKQINLNLYYYAIEIDFKNVYFKKNVSIIY